MSNRRHTNTTQTGNHTRIIWDDSKMRSHRPNVLKVSGGRGEIILLFGRDEALGGGKDQEAVQFSDRIIMSPFTAKRFAILLDNVVHNYESKYGVLKNGVLLRDRLIPTPPLQPPAFKSPEAAEKVELLFELLKNLNLEPAFERSFKVKEKKLLGNRFLLGVEKDSIKPNPHEKLLDICEQIEMPADLMVTFLENLPEASIVGFGFSENETTCIVRAYLEFGIRYYRAMEKKPQNPDPYLSHIGCKWDISDNTKSIVTKYTCYPAYTTKDMLERLSSRLYKDKERSPYKIVKGILDLASSKVGNDKFLFLGVDEGNNPRNSFDINVYRANLQLKDIYSFLLEMCRFYSISDEQFHDLYEPVKTQILGHLAGGIDREGRDFLTVYHGE